LALAMIRVATTFLPPLEMGRMSLITATTAFFALFLINPVGMFINRRIHAWELSGKVKHYLNLYWLYLLIVAILAGFILTVINHFNLIGLQITAVWLWVLICGSLLFNTVNQTLIPLLNLLGFRKSFMTLTLGTIVASFFAAIVLIVSFQPKAEYWLLGLILGQALLSGFGGKVFFGKLATQSDTNNLTDRTNLTDTNHLTDTTNFNQEQIKVLFSFAWPVSIAVGLNWVQTQSYRFFMQDAFGLAELGLFVAGYGISAGLIAAFESVLTTYFQPIFYKQVSNGDKDRQSLAWNQYAKSILPSLILLGCFIAAVAPELTRLILGSAYQSASPFVVWGAIAEVTRVATGIYGMVAHAKMNTRLLIVPNLIGAGIALSLFLWLIPMLGSVGVGIALTLAGTAVMITMHGLMFFTLEMKLPYKRFMQSVGLGGLLAGMAFWGRSVMGDGMGSALFLFGILGLCYLIIQCWLLRSYIFGQEAA